MKETVEYIGVFILVLVMLSIVYCIIMLIFNGILSCCTNFRIKLPVQKRFVGKITPIYKLTYWTSIDNKRNYFLQKWELEYTDFNFGSWQTVLVPFSTLFQRLRYVDKKKFDLGVLPDDVVATLDLAKKWNFEYDKLLAENRKKLTKSNKFKAMMNNLNKDFNENYTE